MKRKYKVVITEDDVTGYKEVIIYDGGPVKMTRTNNIRMRPEDRVRWYEGVFKDFEFFYGKLH